MIVFSNLDSEFVMEVVNAESYCLPGQKDTSVVILASLLRSSYSTHLCDCDAAYQRRLAYHLLLASYMRISYALAFFTFFTFFARSTSSILQSR
ncbi:hypothetical protein BDZ91DRAFT_530105 [Kalaharituber pfeilii]|nr:hypothetical protein BDZ91DRAFT_530105 [Kalaharituber pfeilii]